MSLSNSESLNEQESSNSENIKRKSLSRPKAIQAFCKECLPDESRSKCANTPCSLWRFRLGAPVSTGISRPKAVRLECLSCQGGSSSFVATCPTTNCHLWPYRFGVPEKSYKMSDNYKVGYISNLEDKTQESIGGNTIGRVEPKKLNGSQESIPMTSKITSELGG